MVIRITNALDAGVPLRYAQVLPAMADARPTARCPRARGNPRPARCAPRHRLRRRSV